MDIGSCSNMQAGPHNFAVERTRSRCDPWRLVRWSATSMPVAAFILTLLFVSASPSTPVSCWAQEVGKVYRIGFLRAGRPPDTFIAGFQQGLRERGYIEGKNVTIEYRFTDGSLDQLPRLVEELLQLKVDPADLAGKRLELLKQLVPSARRVAVLWRPANPSNKVQLIGAEAAARTLGLQVQPLAISSPDDFESAFKAARGADILLQLDDPLLLAHRRRLAELATRSRLPAMHGFKETAEAGGLMSYGANLQDLYRRSATYVDKIFKGAKPGDLPVEQPIKFDFVITMRTAKALGLTIPPFLLSRADQLLE